MRSPRLDPLVQDGRGVLRGDPMDVFDTTLASARAHDRAVGWEAFGDVEFIVQMAIVLLIAVLLSAIIAYHPLTRSKAASLEAIEQPKTFIMYSMVGAVIAQIVKVQPSMALVIFGIGGLLRFRTNVGEAKDTGRVILVTVVGLCCGLELYVVAVLATAFGWVLIFALERRRTERVLIQGLERDVIARAAHAYATILRDAGCSILGEETNVKKGTISIVYRAPRSLDSAELERRLAEVPEELRGATNWEVA